MTIQGRRLVLLVVGCILVLAITIPVMGADPSPSASPPAQAKPDNADKSPKPGKAEKAEKSAKPGNAEKATEDPEIAVTVTGTVAQTTDGQGRPTFTLTDGATTWSLSAGPTWYWGDKNPLAAYVGTSVTVTGTHQEGQTDLSVDTVDGAAIRAPGRPPWAGGPWVVGPTHPGWKAWMADGKPGNGNGRQASPGPSPEPSPGG